MADIVFYKDLSLDFIPHPVSGDVRPIVNEVAIRRSILNLVMSKKGSKPFNPEYGCDIHNYLFGYEPGFTEYNISDVIKKTIAKFEARVTVTNVDVRFEENDLYLNIGYIIKNLNKTSSVETLITRTA
jgi:phage baseplate assembly protein W